MRTTLGALVVIAVCACGLAACSPAGTTDASAQKIQLNTTLSNQGNNAGGGGGGGGGY